MKLTPVLFAGAMIAFATSFAQKAPFKFGDIPMEDMKMTVYPKDSAAEAVVLGDFGMSTIDYTETKGFFLVFERVRRVKILNKEGLKHADFSINLWRSGDNEEELGQLKVVTYNLENNKIVETKAKSESFFKEQRDKNLTVMKIAWTNVKEGSIIEISYRLRSDFIFNFQDWEFQSEIPTRWSEYRVTTPEWFNYSKYMQGYVPLAISETDRQGAQLNLTYRESANDGYGGKGARTELHTETVQYMADKFRWAAKDVPAFRAEPYITTSNDYISKINFELAWTKFPNATLKNYTSTWPEIGQKYWEEVKDDINGNNSLKDLVAKITAGATTDEMKVSMIFDYVRQNVLWNEVYTRYPLSTPKKVLDEKKGSSGDINVLLASMLEKASIPVKMVLLSTRNHGILRQELAISSQFNYAICQAKLGEKFLLLDATSRILPIGILPERCLNGSGLVVGQDYSNWVELKPLAKSRTMVDLDVILSENGELAATAKMDKSGYHSAKARNRYLLKGEGEYVKEMSGPLELNVSKSEFTNVNDIQLPFKETHTFNATDRATIANNTIYFNPFFLGYEDSNPFKAEKREYPVDFGNTFEEWYIAKIRIPEGYVVEELPATKVFAMPNNAGRYTYNFVQTGNVINLSSSLVINRAMFTQDEYPSLREFYSHVVAKQAEQVVLKKQ